MPLQLTPADDTHCTFARDLTRRAMLPYYREYDLLWIEEAFDEAWGWREQWLVTEGSTLLGFCSLSQDRQALFIRELHLLPEHRGRGVGGWVLEQLALWARVVSMGLIAPNQWTAFQSVTHRVIHRLCHVNGPVSIKDDPHAPLPFVALPACRT